MTVAIASTVAEEARELIAQGPGAVTIDTPRTVLVYLARKYVKEQQSLRKRQEARQVEATVREEINRAPRRSSAVVVDDLRRVALRQAYSLVYGTTFAPTAGESVTWGEATREQHARRVESQRELANGIHADIDRHLEAIAVLDEFGIDRLADL